MLEEPSGVNRTHLTFATGMRRSAGLRRCPLSTRWKRTRVFFVARFVRHVRRCLRHVMEVIYSELCDCVYLYLWTQIRADLVEANTTSYWRVRKEWGSQRQRPGD